MAETEDIPITPTTPARGGWTDAEKVALLFAIIEAKGEGPIPWKEVKVPEGRTVKACTHVIAKMKDEAAKIKQGPAGGTDGKENGTKRKVKDGAEVTPKTRKRAKTVKAEPELEDDEETK